MESGAARIEPHPEFLHNSDAVFQAAHRREENAPGIRLRAIAPDVLRHRIGVTYEAEAENVHTEEIINTILNEVQVP